MSMLILFQNSKNCMDISIVKLVLICYTYYIIISISAITL